MSEWSECFVRICACVCVLVWLLARALVAWTSLLSGGCWVVLGHQFLTRTRLASLYQGQLPVASGLLGLSPFGREYPIWGLPSSPAGMGVRDVWPQVFYQKPEINFQVFTVLPTYEVCQ